MFKMSNKEASAVEPNIYWKKFSNLLIERDLLAKENALLIRRIARQTQVVLPYNCKI